MVGFALQDLLSSLMSGLALQVEQPFRIGDWVRFGEQRGRVLEMNWRATKLLTFHHDIIVIPNNLVTREPLINVSSPSPKHRRRIDVGLRYGYPPNQVKESILRAIAGVEDVAPEPAPYVLAREFGDSAIVYRAHCFTTNFAQQEFLEDQVRSRIWYPLRRDGMSVPFPIREVQLKHVDAEAERSEQHAQTVALLEAVPFLIPLTADERDRLAQRLTVAYYAAGKSVFWREIPRLNCVPWRRRVFWRDVADDRRGPCGHGGVPYRLRPTGHRKAELPAAAGAESHPGRGDL